jgi:hypothetical protein
MMNINFISKRIQEQDAYCLEILYSDRPYERKMELYYQALDTLKYWKTEYMKHPDRDTMKVTYIPLPLLNDIPGDGKPIMMEFLNSRCYGRCDGVNDICVSDMRCDKHSILGCEECFGKR